MEVDQVAGRWNEIFFYCTCKSNHPINNSYGASPRIHQITVTATSFPITVGAGGTAIGPGVMLLQVLQEQEVSNSTFSTVTSAGGGRGGAYNRWFTPVAVEQVDQEVLVVDTDEEFCIPTPGATGNALLQFLRHKEIQVGTYNLPQNNASSGGGGGWMAAGG